MARRRTGATAASTLPAALAGALLVSAPFAGTTTAPLAKSQPRAYSVQAAGTAAPAAQGSRPDAAGSGSGLRLDVSPSSLVTLGGAELLLVGVGIGVIVTARRRRSAED